MNNRIHSLGLFASAALGALAVATLAVPPQPRAGEPLPGLSALEAFRFREGKHYYETPLTVAEGLGPAFNQPSCAACHEVPVGGWGATSVQHFGNVSGGVFSFLDSLGGPVRQMQAISPECLENLPPPSIANHVRSRVTPSVLAFGLVEAIPDSAIVALEDPTDANGDGISGRAHRVTPLETPGGPQRIGRFGWKAQIATVRSFSGDAARTEMGLTNAVVPDETAPNGNAATLAACDTVPEIEDVADEHGLTFVEAVTAFQRYLAPPPQSPRSGMAGEAVFQAIGCAKCHTPQFVTSGDPSLEPILRSRPIRVYTDFLLHDMGPLADGIPDEQAQPNEMKTPPLWNLRTRPVLLHDGSANSPIFATRVTAAIQAHGGEATASRNAFNALSASDRLALLSFLDSLGRDDYDVDGDGLVTRNDLAEVLIHAGDADVSPDEPWAGADLNGNRRIDADEINQLREMLGVPADCNGNGILDTTEIASGAVPDDNHNGVPDECDQVNCTARALRVTGAGGAIPDAGGGSLTRQITVPAQPGNPPIQAIRVTLDLEHTWANDLLITLRRGGESPIQLHANCGGFHDLNGRYHLTDLAWEGSSGLMRICDGTLVSQGGSNPETQFVFAPGAYRPSQGTAQTAFSTMRNGQIGATWTLSITDSRTNDVGTLNGWSIQFRYADPAPADCDNAGGPDCQQIAANPGLDCDLDGILDSCQSMAADCDANGVRDRCDLAAGEGDDCNGNGTLDACDVAAGTVADCDSNGVPDSCEIADGDAADTDADGQLDRCERARGDLNLDGAIDAADLTILLGMWGQVNPAFGDFNGDGLIGAADLAFILASWSQPTPTIGSVTPASGPAAGGTAITISGTNLNGATAVTVGGAAATGVVVVNATTITAVTPAGTAGARNVTVTTPGGTATAANAFTYLAAPTITGVVPNSGPTVGGTPITITGTALTGATSVTIGGAAATSVVVVNATTITAVTPAGTAGERSLAVATPGGTATAPIAFTYSSGPTIFGVTPSIGSVLGGTTVTVTGTGFTGATSVTVGGVAATGLAVLNPTTIIAVTPAGTAGARTVSVTTPWGTGSLENGFTYFAAPTVSGVSPNSGPVSGGTMVTITGTDFWSPIIAVTIGGRAATSVNVVSGTQLTAVTPAGTVGTATVLVMTMWGTGSLANGFTYLPSLPWATVLEQAPDPTVVTTEAYRAAIVATGLPWRVRHTQTQIEMLLVPPGTFNMGCSASNQYGCGTNESPIHAVTLTNAFYLGRYEVTQAQWTAVMGSNPSWFQSASTEVAAAQVPLRPVERVFWETIQGFNTATGLRLPTEAEWEYAYRAGTAAAFHSFSGYPNGTGDDALLGNIAWFSSNSFSQTRPIGGKQANALGLHDMAGNVWEWVNDWYGTTYYENSPSTNPPGPATGTTRVLRGGAWCDVSNECRSSGRGIIGGPVIVNGSFGFRAARNP